MKIRLMGTENEITRMKEALKEILVFEEDKDNAFIPNRGKTNQGRAYLYGVQTKDDYFAEEEHTAYQWLVLGRVPLDEAKWFRRERRFPVDGDDWGSGYWYYCYGSNTLLDPAKAADLLKTAPQLEDCYNNGGTYDGRPWW